MSDLSRLAYATAGEVAAMIQRKEVSSREAVDYFLGRVEALDTSINSVVTIDAERARAEAEAADTESGWRNVPRTAARGADDDQGFVSNPRYADDVGAHRNSRISSRRRTPGPVARLREAGAIIYGKTNLPIYAGDLQSYNDIFGTTNNPHDTTRTPGGSSGGSGAALACGFTPLELGSDIGGSIRLPAHMSGVTGHKPSYGIVPAHGQIPGPPGTLTMADLAVAGPMARSVEDLELGLDIMAGPNRWEQPAWRLELPAPRRQALKDYRIATWLDDPRCPVEPEVRTLLENAASALARAGATVSADARPEFSLEKVAATFMALLQSALAGGVSRDKIEEYAQSSGNTSTDHTRRLFAMRHREWLSYNERRMQLRKRWEEFFQDWDVMLLPVMPCPAIKHDHSEPQAGRTALVGGQQRPYWDLVTWMAPAGACLLPATVIPVGQLDTGLPIGVQIVGPYLEDRTSLHVAKHLFEMMGGCPRPAGF